ncbi:MAG TPA: glycoside hydrolase family 3 N-terminal domain-containing protein [Chloroflexia bacterium]|nr:glycoside hydrolase family 3 N-terminal domain-containing protein [Chloroflexia bacterium]
MNLRQKVGQLIMVEIPGTRLTSEVEAFIRDCHPAGVALFGHNLAGPWTTAKFISDMQAVAADAGDAPLLVGMDQEGGQVSHLRYPCAELPSQMARTAASGPPAAGEAAEIMGSEMQRLGVNLAFAPVLDVNTNPANPVIGPRAFSDDPDTVAACGIAAIEGLRRAGIFSMAKHFPGHGDTDLDSHLARNRVMHSLERLREVELKPFRAAIAAGVDSICSAHVSFPALDPSGLPATLSPRIMTDLLRGELGFKGVLFSDALVMDAIAAGKATNIPPAAIAAVNAGIDCLMVLGKLSQQRQCYEMLVHAVEIGLISERRLDEAVERVQSLRLRASLPPAVTPAWPDMSHQAAATRMAQAAVTCLRDRQNLLPLTGNCSDVGVIEFASGSISPVETARNEPLGASTLAFLLGRRLPEARFLALQSDAPNALETLDAFLRDCTRVVVATRSAILDPAQVALLKHAASQGLPVIHMALRSPYDATLEPRIGTVLLTYGDQPAGVAAAVDVLLGEASASGKLPIQLEKPAQPPVLGTLPLLN